MSPYLVWSFSGSGCIIGYNIGKCIDFAIGNKDCRFCSFAAQKGAQPNPHDCRKNFSGSSKAMESSICEVLFRKEQYKVMVTDEDASPEVRIKSQVNLGIEKWSDINHVVRILGNLLYEAKTTNFGPKNDRLTDRVTGNIAKSFRTALMENKGDAEGMQLAITSIVPHAFGEHDSCGKWCKFHEDPAAYRSKHLPEGNSLQGDGLRAFLTESIQAFVQKNM